MPQAYEELKSCTVDTSQDKAKWCKMQYSYPKCFSRSVVRTSKDSRKTAHKCPPSKIILIKTP